MNRYKGHEYGQNGYKRLDMAMVGPAGAVGFNLSRHAVG